MRMILAAHGRYAQEVLNSANMVYGVIEGLDTVTFLPGENVETLKRKYQEILSGYGPDEEVLFLVDLFGGSPYNAAFETVVMEERMDVITGLSLPMILEAAELRELEPGIKASEMYEKLDTASYAKSCKALLKETEENQKEEDEL